MCSHVELGLGLDRPCRAHPDPVAAIDTRRVRQHGVEVCGNPSVKTTSAHRDGVGVLRVVTASLHTLVAQHAFVVVADVQVVLDLRLLASVAESANGSVNHHLGDVVDQTAVLRRQRPPRFGRDRRA